jgi:hypothetical protein
MFWLDSEERRFWNSDHISLSPNSQWSNVWIVLFVAIIIWYVSSIYYYTVVLFCLLCKKRYVFFFRWMWLFRIESSASILYVDFMQKPNHWWIYLPVLTLYRSQIGKSATQQPNRTGDFLTLYRSQISKSAMQNPNRQVTYRVYTEVKLVNRRCSSVTIR